MLGRDAPQEEREGIPDLPPISSAAEAQPPAVSRGGIREPRPVEEAAEQEMEGLYIISVAARLLNVHPQTLRKYERLGLVSPSRTAGMLRLYSRADIMRIRLIRHLEENLGFNLAGVYVALDILDRLTSLRDRLFTMEEMDSFRQTVEEEFASLFRLFGFGPGEGSSPSSDGADL